MPRRTDLPPMPLCNGCGACCGPVSARLDEAKRIRKYIRENDVAWVVPASEPGTVDVACGFLRKQEDGTYRCAVHPVRPWSCRAFGVIEEMPCPFFPEAVVTSFPSQKAQLLHLVDVADKYLGEYFEPGYLKRIGGRETRQLLEAMVLRAVQEGRLSATPSVTPAGSIARTDRRAAQA